jgi:alanine racemase
MSQSLSFIELNRCAARANVAAFRSHLGPTQELIAVVKANAYGHGLNEIVGMVEDLVDGFQVDDIEELRLVRPKTAKRILVLGYVAPHDLEEAVRLHGELALYDTERLELLGAMQEVAHVHLKIDALLGRQGLLTEMLPDFIPQLLRFPNVKLAGVYGHYSNLEDTPLRSHAEAQQARFERARGMLIAFGLGAVPTHFSSTAGILAFEGPDSEHALVRLGIGLYGLYPSTGFERLVDLKPVLRWVTHLAQVKDVPPGYPIGYGLTFVTSRPTRMGIVPQGYADGYDRGLSGCGEVLVAGRPCPIIGRIAMNMFAIDLTEVGEVHPGAEVVLIGEQDGERITAEVLAGWTDTINYEVVARISALLPRSVV